MRVEEDGNVVMSDTEAMRYGMFLETLKLTAEFRVEELEGKLSRGVKNPWFVQATLEANKKIVAGCETILEDLDEQLG